jgi:hypothetical protein
LSLKPLNSNFLVAFFTLAYYSLDLYLLLN